MINMPFSSGAQSAHEAFRKQESSVRGCSVKFRRESSNFGPIMNPTMLLNHFRVYRHLQQNYSSLQSVDELRLNIYYLRAVMGRRIMRC